MIHKLNDGEIILQSGGVTGTRLNVRNGCEYVQLVLEPGSRIAPHSLPIPVTFYVLTGTGIVHVAGEEYRVTVGELIEVDAGAQRGWRNDGGATLSLLVIKHV